jgi:predicted ATPase
MITRIKINGFKSLLNTELFLGPFTCIAGSNAVGKSNFFDALQFLSRLADDTILQAAKSIRSDNQRHSSISDLFYKNGNNCYNTICFEVDFIVDKASIDDLGQNANATITSLCYKLELKLNNDDDSSEKVQITREELIPIIQKDIKTKLYFKYSPEWYNSIISGRRSTKAPFISTENDKIKLHQDGNKGRTSEFIAENMPRTLLSTVTAESPTAFMARHEMRNWIMLQFEPTSLRQPNSIYEIKNSKITANGNNLPATLYRLNSEKKNSDIYQHITNRLKGLVSDFNEIFVDKDDKRDLLTLYVKFKDGLILPAQSLSDGSLRFLGLAIINEDSKRNGLICMEEPENGINPKKVPQMVDLLENMAVDATEKVDDDNPLRQVIINSHSPLVVSSVSDESIYFAIEREKYEPSFKKKIQFTGFTALPLTWKTKNGLVDATTLGEINYYLDYNMAEIAESEYLNEPTIEYSNKKNNKVTVVQKAIQLKLDF